MVVADAYFSKEPFVSKLMLWGLDVVSRLRDDVRLRYIVQIKKTGKRGRTKINGDKVDFSNLDNKHFSIESVSDDIAHTNCSCLCWCLKTDCQSGLCRIP